MEIYITTGAIISAALIFALRVTDMSLDTLRMLFVMRGRKGVAWLLGFCQSVIFVVAITSVLNNLDNLLNIIGYAAGFATGTVIGITIEERLAIGHTHLRIISSRRGAAIAERLRAESYAVTEIPARGKDGMVTMLAVSVRRKNIDQVRNMVNDVDSEAFITAEDIRPLRQGFWRA